MSPDHEACASYNGSCAVSAFAAVKRLPHLNMNVGILF
jgi:hypothetical protein